MQFLHPHGGYQLSVTPAPEDSRPSHLSRYSKHVLHMEIHRQPKSCTENRNKQFLESNLTGILVGHQAEQSKHNGFAFQKKKKERQTRFGV